MNQVVAITGSRLQKAIDRIKDLKLTLTIPEAQPIAKVIERIEDVDPAKAVVIARTLSAMQAFDALVSEKLEGSDYSDRFNVVTVGFNSIIEDSKRQVLQEERGGAGFAERVGNVYMKLTRGDVADRFVKIENVYRDVIDESGKTLDLQRGILEAYVDARASLKEGEIAACEIFEQIEKQTESAKAKVDELNVKVQNAPADMSAPDRGRLELERDDAVNEARRQDDRYQIAKDLAEMLTVAYSVTETIFGRYNQAHKVLDRLHQKAVIFFDTQRPVMTAMKATYTGLMHVNEMSKTQTAMQDGLNNSLETLASLGSKVLIDGVRVAHGPSIKASSVKMLVDATVSFQEEVGTIVRESRELATVEAATIRKDVEDGKQRVARFVAMAA
ncbi:cell surface protein [Pararhizobium sp. BT-229]|uniref:cell surface protein n=1 Tax=Pararhizobium sp. BT-229 TaxID=2986923 RepID=UPI0021F7B421|nr:cell surface protein [Pararhizobium sp. BT-229]MCV9964011.1 cell surface protein [Pararhizobium sp. BT-229]